MPTIRLPTIELRDYQQPFWKAMEGGCRRAACVWPRRSGKDTVSLAWTAWDAHRHIGSYWHLFPEQTQARKALWNGINREGQRIIDVAFPHAIREQTLDNEMFIRFKCGSTWQLGGSDRYDALVGSNPRGVVFSEFAISNPRAYDYIRPILAENGGWALFPYTPRGRNHGYELFTKLGSDPASFAELLTCDDTGHISAEALEAERREMSDELYQQEYFASWDFGQEGSYYTEQMNKALTSGRICDVPYDEALPVWVAMDLGFTDATAMWFFQVEYGGRVRFIDYEEHNGRQLKFYSELLRSKPYNYGEQLILPHDASHERLGAESIEEQFEALGWRTAVLPVERSVLPGIETVRSTLGRSLFDHDATEHGRACLNAYRREFDDKRSVFKQNPLHDWSSHGADAMRYACRAIAEGYTSTHGWEPIDWTDLNRAVI